MRSVDDQLNVAFVDLLYHRAAGGAVLVKLTKNCRFDTVATKNLGRAAGGQDLEA